MEVRVRFAPSPTGLLHVGNVRIALLNYLFAKSHDGKFVLRIDDTDKERSTIESENMIIDDLKWLGIAWDEFFRQSERFDTYDKAIDYLKNIGRVYPCYETKDELSIKRKVQISRGIPPVYDRASLKLSQEEKDRLDAQGVQKYWRFKLNENDIVTWKDLVHGEISIPLSTVSDPILVKPDGSYVYTFASVVDDANLGITHIIRGDDHITNTAVQIDMFKALTGQVPEFGHIPLLMSIDGQDVSKRTSSPLSMVNLRKDGILAQAILNVLASLGTSNDISGDDKLSDLISKFSFEKMSLSSPKFNIEDVKALTRKMISEKSFEEVKPDLLEMELSRASEKFWDTIKSNISSLEEAKVWYDILFKPVETVNEDKDYVRQMNQTLEQSFDYDDWINKLKKVSGRTGRDLFHPIRMVLTGQENGPELKKICDFLGHSGCQVRIKENLR